MRIHRLFVAMLLASASLTAVACGSGSTDMSGSAIDEPVEPAEPGQGGEPSGGEPSGGEPSGGEPSGGEPVEPAGGEPSGSDPSAKPGGSGINPGGSGAQPGGAGGTGGSTEFESPADYLNSLVPTQRVDMADLEEACEGNAVCTANLDSFVEALTGICPEKTGCTDPVANLLYNTRSSSMRSSGTYPATFPQAKDVLATYEAVEAASGGEQPSGGEPSGGEPSGGEPATGSVDIEQVAQDTAAKLNATAGDGVIWEEVSAIIVEVAGGGAEGRATSDAILIAMKDASPSIEHYAAMQALVNGEKVAAGEAAAAIEAIAATMGG